MASSNADVLSKAQCKRSKTTIGTAAEKGSLDDQGSVVNLVGSTVDFAGSTVDLRAGRSVDLEASNHHAEFLSKGGGGARGDVREVLKITRRRTRKAVRAVESDARYKEFDDKIVVGDGTTHAVVGRLSPKRNITTSARDSARGSRGRRVRARCRKDVVMSPTAPTSSGRSNAPASFRVRKRRQPDAMGDSAKVSSLPAAYSRPVLKQARAVSRG